jgi:predicted RND superfamily exporter protein
MSYEQINFLLFIVVSHILVAIFCVYIGMQIARSLNIETDNSKYYKKNTRSKKESIEITSPIQIDEKKLVIDINTNDLTKKFDALGEVTNSENNISSSINKLKNMKG